MSTFVGSPSYAAPEIIANEKYSGPAADVWSLGVIVYTILTGQLPFQSENGAASLDRIASASFELPDSLSERAGDLISRILRRRPEERLTVAQIWEHPWISDGCDGPLLIEPTPVDSDVHDQVLAALKDRQCDVSDLPALLAAQSVGAVTASYYLLADKYTEEKKERLKNEEIAAMSRRLLGMLAPGTRDRAASMGSPLLMRPKARARIDFDEEVKSQRDSMVSEKGDGVTLIPSIDVQSHLEEDKNTDSVFPSSAPTPTILSPSDPVNSTFQLRPATAAATLLHVDECSSVDDDDSCSISSARTVTGARSSLAIDSEVRERANTWTNQARRTVSARPRTSSSITPKIPVVMTPVHLHLGPHGDDGDSISELPSISKRISLHSDAFSPARPTAVMRQLQARAMLQRRQGRPVSACDPIRMQSSNDSLPSVAPSPAAAPMRRMSYKITTLGETTETSLSLSKPVFKRAQSSVAQKSAAKSPSRGGGKSPLNPDSSSSSTHGAMDTLDLATTRAFGAATTSSLPALDLLAELKQALVKEGVRFEHLHPRKLHCECRVNELEPRQAGRRRSSLTLEEFLQWEMEVCALAKLGLSGIRLRRVSGDCWKYKAKIARIVKLMKL
eukprot:m.240389 g.240389  ORF g.240389 m.240389 type:complete len:618 (-) comp23352_c0_seq1:17-1870(-)